MSSSIPKCNLLALFLKITVAVFFCVITLSLHSCAANRSGQNLEQNDVTENDVAETANSDSPKPNRMINLDFLIVGTLNDIRLEKLEWASLTVKYWLFNSDRSYSPGRVITISDMETIRELNHSFATKSVAASIMANQPRFVLTLTNGQQWSLDMSFPNWISCCQIDNTKNSCYITLSNTQFYEKLREICFEHEKTITPDVIIENIVLCNGGIGNEIIETKVPYSPL
jgi:hypothetical protein